MTKSTTDCVLSRTFLRPLEGWQKTSKTFTAPSEKSSDYNLGTFFSFEHKTFSDLKEYAEFLTAQNDTIGIYGEPTEQAKMDMVLKDKTTRRTINFDYPTNQALHIFDLDGWAIGEATREAVKPRLTDPDTMAYLVNTMLRNEGFGILADASKVIILTSSQWTLNKLNCHLYFNFSGPIRVEAMREFTTALAKVKQRTVFDPAPYKSVQPDFITPPTCVGFADPLAGKRIFYSEGLTEQVSVTDFQELINKTIKDADWTPTGTGQALPVIGINWIATVETCVGDERGINEPCFRAAAQLVQEVGRNNVLNNINTYASQMHDATWNTLAKKGSERGHSQSDKATYDLARFRQYLKSATEKNFGEGVDIMVKQVDEAIEKAKNGDLIPLLSSPVVLALNTLKTKHMAQFIVLKAKIKSSKTVPMADIQNLMRSGHFITDAGGEEGTEISFANDEGMVAENKLIDTVLAQYEMISDSFGNSYAQVPGNGDGGYKMMRVGGSLVDVFYFDGLAMSGDQVGPNFGRKVLSKLLGRESKAIVSTFEKKLIGTRVISEGDNIGDPTYINLGMQGDGIFKTVKIKHDGLELMTHQDAPVKWMHGTPALTIATSEQIEDRFGYDCDLIPYLLETLPKFVKTDEGDLTKTLMWLCAVFSDKTLAYALELTGLPAAGKSTAADFLKDLVDPSETSLGAGADRTVFNQNSTENLIADIEQRHVTILDNVSSLPTKSQDLLCSIATGLRKSERILYTQQQMDRVVKRPLIITALSPVITRPDLRSRVVSVEVYEADFNRDYLAQWSSEKPYLVAGLMQLTSKALELLRSVTVKPDGITPRDIFLACVDSAVHNKAEVGFDFVVSEKEYSAAEMVHDSTFIHTFTCWMDEAFKGEDQASFSTRGLNNTLLRFVDDHAGMEVSGKVMDRGSVPETGSGLGWLLTKSIEAISRTSDWKYNNHRKTNNGKRYVFARKAKKTLDSVKDLW